MRLCALTNLGVAGAIIAAATLAGCADNAEPHQSGQLITGTIDPPWEASQWRTVTRTNDPRTLLIDVGLEGGRRGSYCWADFRTAVSRTSAEIRISVQTIQPPGECAWTGSGEFYARVALTESYNDESLVDAATGEEHPLGPVRKVMPDHIANPG